jgi:hypothetical protein
MTLAKHWPHHPGEKSAVIHDRGPMTLANAWPHEAGENANPWPHQPGDWHSGSSAAFYTFSRALQAAGTFLNRRQSLRFSPIPFWHQTP